MNFQTATQILPDGPSLNRAFSITAIPNELWVVYGDYDVNFNPYPLDRLGFGHLQNMSWVNVPYSDQFDARSLVNVTVNPSSPIWFRLNHSVLNVVQAPIPLPIETAPAAPISLQFKCNVRSAVDFAIAGPKITAPTFANGI